MRDRSSAALRRDACVDQDVSVYMCLLRAAWNLSNRQDKVALKQIVLTTILLSRKTYLFLLLYFVLHSAFPSVSSFPSASNNDSVDLISHI